MESSLSEDLARVCEGHLSQDKCFTALKGMAHNKAPGSDGLRIEFYVKLCVRQGCPLCPLLYVLYAEVLACNIRGNPSISGLALPGKPQPVPVIFQYADDTTLVVNSDWAIILCFNTYSLFEKGSGSRLNLTNAEVCGLAHVKIVSIIQSTHKIKVLGIYISPAVTDKDKWRPRISAVQNVLHSWCQQSLSLSGRALIINSLASPASGMWRLWFLCQTLYHGNSTRLSLSFFRKASQTSLRVQPSSSICF